MVEVGMAAEAKVPSGMLCCKELVRIDCQKYPASLCFRISCVMLMQIIFV